MLKIHSGEGKTIQRKKIKKEGKRQRKKTVFNL